MKTRIVASVLASLAALAAQAADPVPNRFTAGTPAKAAEVNANFDALVAQISALEARLAAAVPVGTVLAYAGTTLPEGFLWCNGDEVSAATYPALFAAIGITHGRGVALNAFKVPDYRGRFLRGVDGGAGLDPDAAVRQPMADFGVAGDVPGSVQGHATARPSATAFTTGSNGDHQHFSATTNALPGSYEPGRGSGTGGTGIDYGPEAPPTTSAGAHTHTITSGGDAETRPVNASVNWIIKY